jgi:hypothetical protein
MDPGSLGSSPRAGKSGVTEERSRTNRTED